MGKYGHFTQDGQEYVVTNQHTPRDWFNCLWNETYLAMAGQHMNGFSLYQSEEGIVTNLFGKQDEHEEPRALYLRDRESEKTWSASFLPCAIDEPPKFFECCHGLGYSTMTAERNGIRVSHRIFVPRKLSGEVWTVELVNPSKKERKISLFPAASIKLDGLTMPYGYLGGLKAEYDPKQNYLFFANTTYTVVDEKYRAFMYADRKVKRWDVSKEHFLGKTRSMTAPEAVTRGKLGNSVASTEPMIGAMQFDFTLKPGASRTVNIVFGIVKDRAEANRMKRLLENGKKIEAEFEATQAACLKRTQGLALKTPNSDLDNLFNLWFKHQLVLMADWARFYFKGYRDTCQDATGMALLNPDRARAMLHKALDHQRSDGFAPRAFRLPSMDVASADKHYADSPSWISMATEAILRETGDLSFLDETAPYSDGGEGTVWEHNLRAMEFLWNDRGSHGLSLIHCGDWCDLMDRVGHKGKGESVWMTFATATVLQRVARIADWRGDKKTAALCRRRFATLQKALLKHAWEGDRFIAAINDDGKRYGTNKSKEGRYFTNPQSWSMISGVVDAETYTKIIEGIEPHIDTPVGPVHNWPPFSEYDPGLGQLSGTPPGFFTNGNVYCHAAGFKIHADYLAGRADKAYDTLLRILPDETKSEPFAQANGYTGPTAHRMVHHTSDDPWRTGTVAWNFINVLCGLFGFKGEPEGFRLRPQLPSKWKKAEILRPFRGTDFEIKIRRGTKPGIKVNGEAIEGDFIAVPKKGIGKKVVQVECIIPA
ncbi:MAG: hypothetical protein DRP64_01790 [Verrucomicrobia bacterium]|nr:MAG: hypothetical protein DRP64_01790 [Verrucomicrobiota bacterium]